MFKLDDNFLIELGLGALPPVEKNKMLAHIYETLEMRVGMRLAEKMTNEQLDEFEAFINNNDEAGALKWLETNFPNYKQVVAEELEKLKSEIKQAAPQIVQQALAEAGNASPAPEPQAYVPQQPAPAQQPAFNQPQAVPSQPQFQQSQQPMTAEPQSYAPTSQQPTVPSQQQFQQPVSPVANPAPSYQQVPSANMSAQQPVVDMSAQIAQQPAPMSQPQFQQPSMNPVNNPMLNPVATPQPAQQPQFQQPVMPPSEPVQPDTNTYQPYTPPQQ